jgi:hypothetical protein
LQKKGLLNPWLICFLLASLTLNQCQNGSDKNTSIVARVYENVLGMDEIEPMLGPNMTRQDSFLFIKEYIDNWIQRQVLINHAKMDGYEENSDINNKVKAYKQDLMLFEYSKKLLSQNLDTNITLGETKEYYETHQENFELKQNIIRFVFIKMPKSLDKKYNYWPSFQKADDEALTKMAIVALKNNGNAFLEKEKWVAFDDILKVVPINTYNQESFINNNRIFKIEETNYIWYIHILDFRIKDHISPFEFVEENINQIVLNKRKVQLMKKLENQLVTKAIKAKKIKVYLPQYE